MNYMENSWFIKILQGSWFLGWLVATSDESSNYYQGSYSQRTADAILTVLIRGLKLIALKLVSYSTTSRIITNFAGVFGLLLIIVALADLLVVSFTLETFVFGLIIFLIGLYLMLKEFAQWILEGSKLIKLLHLWGKID